LERGRGEGKSEGGAVRGKGKRKRRERRTREGRKGEKGEKREEEEGKVEWVRLSVTGAKNLVILSL
jgi:hypothetical protein